MNEITEEQIAEAAAYWESPEGRADRMATRATRLHRLIKLKAPAIIIEQARRLVFDSLMHFPIDDEAAKSADRVKRDLDAHEQKFLQEHGYYDDLENPHG